MTYEESKIIWEGKKIDDEGYLFWMESICLLWGTLIRLASSYGMNYLLFFEKCSNLKDFNLLQLAFIDQLTIEDVIAAYPNDKFKGLYVPDKDDAINNMPSIGKTQVQH